MRAKIAGRFEFEKPKGITFNPLNSRDRSRTQQHFKDESDINKIIANYRKTGVLTDPLRPPTRTPYYGDFTSLGDYHTQQNAVINTQTRFQRLPAHIRDRFENDPAVMIEWINNPANKDEAIKLGLRPKETAPYYESPTVPQAVATPPSGNSTAAPGTGSQATAK